MTRNVTLDFGRAIAYFIPGVIALFGFSELFQDVRVLFQPPPTGAESGLVRFTLLVAASIVVGMIVSVLRASTVDRSFGFNLKKMSLLGRLPSHYARCPRRWPDYSKLTSEGALEAFREAKADDKRPYQFYGNTLIALLILLGAKFLSGGSFLPQTLELRVIGAVIILTALLLLYLAARFSHWRYMETIAKLNSASLSNEDR